MVVDTDDVSIAATSSGAGVTSSRPLRRAAKRANFAFAAASDSDDEVKVEDVADDDDAFDDSLSSSESEPFHQSKRVYRAPPAEEDRRRQKNSTRTDTDDVGNASEIVVELTGGEDAQRAHRPERR